MVVASSTSSIFVAPEPKPVEPILGRCRVYRRLGGGGLLSFSWALLLRAPGSTWQIVCHER